MSNCKLDMILSSHLILRLCFSTESVAFLPKALVVYHEEELIKKQKGVQFIGQSKAAYFFSKGMGEYWPKPLLDELPGGDLPV